MTMPTNESIQCNEQSPNQNEDVRAVVTKAKRAAASLWMVLHAKSCRRNQCIYQGCKDTKLVLLHVKCCRMERGQPCNLPGCTQAHNLLDHYHKCQEIRLAAAQQKSGQTCQSAAGKADASAAPPSCLVCSIRARHVRSVLENGPSHAPVPLVAKMPSSE
eukprot:CAMPEP_0196825910 /NCGR_PEP_ID=MMETSP1362-20130617/93331_1 /TAXON_ID=163516 /ORGANISM="Leptocylindrus danicus, Strain CCMP1856" /LENGTH=159 /DNA_ID=CAMNT_0042206419 /DNA_START=456 /DNA_END=935 /DNA_ORIENTATION=+